MTTNLRALFAQFPELEFALTALSENYRARISDGHVRVSRDCRNVRVEIVRSCTLEEAKALLESVAVQLGCAHVRPRGTGPAGPYSTTPPRTEPALLPGQIDLIDMREAAKP